MRTLATLLAVSLLAAFAIACGYKGPPLPPPLKNPAPTTDLRIQQRGNEVLLEFTFPSTTVSGTPLANLEKVEYWELVKRVTTEIADETDPAEEGQEEDEAATNEPSGDEDEGGSVETAEVLPETEEEGETADESNGEEDGGAGETSGVQAESEGEVEDATTEAPLPRGATPDVPLPPPPTKEQMAAVEILEFSATAQPRLTLAAEELTAAIVGDKIVLRLPFSEPPQPAEGERIDEEADVAYTYSVKTYSDEKRVSNWSNLVTLVRRDPPPTPTDFAVEPEAGGVRLSWFNERAPEEGEEADPAPPTPSPVVAPGDEEERSDEVKAYRIYRRDAQARTYPPYIAQVADKLDEYLDRTAQYGNRYIYSLTAVGLYSPRVESALAGEVEVDYQDRFAPPPPRNPIALAEEGRVRILWDASPAPDLRGYIVFRRIRGEQDFLRLNRRPTVDLEYDDLDVSPDTEYEYRVAAVDREDNQGDPSATVSARTP